MSSIQLYALLSGTWQSVNGLTLTPPATWPYGQLGTYKPDATTTGWLPTGTTLTSYPTTGGPAGNIVSGVLTITTSNLLLDSYDFHCKLVIKASNVKITRSRVRGNSTQNSNSGLIDCTDALCVNFVIQDSYIRPDTPMIWWDAIIGHDYEADRCDISGVVDGFGVYNTHSPTGNAIRTYLYGNYVHDLSYFMPDPNHASNNTHNDCVQLQGGDGAIILGNALYGFADPTIGEASYSSGSPNPSGGGPNNPSGPASGYNTNYPVFNINSVLEATPNVSAITNTVFSTNWCFGGGATLNFDAKTTPSNFGSVVNNRLGRDSYYQGGTPGVDGHPGTGGDNSVTFLSINHFTFSSTGGNVYDDNNHPITLRIS